MELNFRQRLFVDYYLGECKGIASAAAKKAGYRHPDSVCTRLLENVGIRAAIDAKVESALSAKEVLARLAEQATIGIDDFITLDAKGQPVLDLKKAKKKRRLGVVKSLTPTKHGIKIELYDKQAALVQLGKYHGLWVDRVNAEVDVGVRDKARYEIPEEDTRFMDADGNPIDPSDEVEVDPSGASDCGGGGDGQDVGDSDVPSQALPAQSESTDIDMSSDA